MTQEDFKTRLAEINAKCEQEKRHLYSQYAHENSTVEVLGGVSRIEIENDKA